MRALPIVLVLGVLLLSARARASDGLIEINQAQALAGNVTPGDTPGFPVILSQPGSYRLTGPLETTSQDAIQVVGQGLVSLDLNGFAVRCSNGGAPCTGSEVGIRGPSHLEVRDGTVTGFGSAGIDAGDNARIEKVEVFGNGRGIDLGGGGTVRGCVVSNNTGDGIQGGNLVVEGNVALSNGGDGISCSSCSIINNTSTSNTLNGINASRGSVIGNTTTFNLQHGIFASFSFVSGNTSSNNTRCGLEGGNTGYVNNVFTGNNGGDTHRQVDLGISLGSNVCGTGTTCLTTAAFNCP